ncbi:MAG: hypothetical protein EXR72_02160 [Myxococcales bacterium]|nr:hypothetical protein [Myxococcales bacterium]
MSKLALSEDLAHAFVGGLLSVARADGVVNDREMSVLRRCAEEIGQPRARRGEAADGARGDARGARPGGHPGDRSLPRRRRFSSGVPRGCAPRRAGRPRPAHRRERAPPPLRARP